MSRKHRKSQPPSQVSLATLRNIFFPQRRQVGSRPLAVFFYTLYACLILGAVLSYSLGFDWPGLLAGLVTANIFILAVVLYGYEPAKALAQMLLTPRIKAHSEQDIESGLDRKNNDQVAIIIPCHNSEANIVKTLSACLKHVKPEQIFVMDNGQSRLPADNTGKIVAKQFPGVRYFYLPVGNKSYAIFYGGSFAVSQYRYSLIIDDDVVLPADFTFRLELFDEAGVKGLVYPLRAISSSRRDNWLSRLITRWQDLEYQSADLQNRFLDRVRASVPRPHGAGSLWITKTMLAVLKRHNGVFHGEDMMMGFMLQPMHSGHIQYVLRLDTRNYLYTAVPGSYFGPAAEGNLWFQRVRSWNVALFTNFWHLIAKPLTTIWRRHNRGLWSLLVLKEDQFYHFYTLLIHILRVPIFLIAGGNPEYWLALGILISIQLTVALAFNYLKLPAEQRQDLFTVVSFPLYKTLDNWMSTVAFLRALLIEIPTNRHHQTIGEMVQGQDLPSPAVMQKLSQINVRQASQPAETLPVFDNKQLVEVHYEDQLLFMLLCHPGMAAAGGCTQRDLLFLLQHAQWVLPQPGHQDDLKRILTSEQSVFRLNFRLFRPLPDHTMADMLSPANSEVTP